MYDNSDYEDLEVTLKIDADKVYVYIDFAPNVPRSSPTNNVYIANTSSLTEPVPEVGGDADCENLNNDK
jgi:hypothetical protein